MRAVFAFPLQVGAARAGVLDMYRAEPGSLTADALTQAVTFADVAMGLLVDGQARAGDTGSSPHLDDALANRLEVYQAQGMVMVDLGVGIEEAMARLRAHSYAEERSIGDVAKDIVAGNGSSLDRGQHMTPSAATRWRATRARRPDSMIAVDRLAEVFVEVADTLVDDFDVIEFLESSDPSTPLRSATPPQPGCS